MAAELRRVGRGYRWTQDADDVLREMAAVAPVREIRKALLERTGVPRSYHAVAARVSRMGLLPPLEPKRDVRPHNPDCTGRLLRGVDEDSDLVVFCLLCSYSQVVMTAAERKVQLPRI